MDLRSCHELPVKCLHDNIDLTLHNVKSTDLREDREGANGIVLCERHAFNEGTISISVRRQQKNRFQPRCAHHLEMQMMVIIVIRMVWAFWPLDYLSYI